MRSIGIADRSKSRLPAAKSASVIPEHDVSDMLRPSRGVRDGAGEVMAVGKSRWQVRLITLRGCVLLALGAGGCSRVDSETAAAIAAVKDGSAQAALQRHLDAQPQCAPVLGFSRETGLLEAGDDNPGAAALVAAGLIEPVAGNRDPHSRSYRPAAAARRWFRHVNPADKTEPFLCFARREVVQIYVIPDSVMPRLNYTFTLTGPPPWMKRADMRHAFPGVALAYGNTFAAEDDAAFNAGRLTYDRIFPKWLNPPFLDYGVNFRGLTIGDLVELHDPVHSSR